MSELHDGDSALRENPEDHMNPVEGVEDISQNPEIAFDNEGFDDSEDEFFDDIEAEADSVSAGDAVPAGEEAP